MEWEYHRHEIDLRMYSDEKVDINDLLKLGKEGWEAIGVIKEIRGYCVLLKRPIEKKEYKEAPQWMPSGKYVG